MLPRGRCVVDLAYPQRKLTASWKGPERKKLAIESLLKSQPMDSSDWTVLGRHRHRIVGDVVEFESTGDFTLTDLARLNELQRQIEQRFDYSLIYVNNIEPGYLAADVRRQAVANNRDPQRRPWSLAMIGVRGAKGLLARAALLLTARAIQLASGRDLPVRLFETEAEARAWLDQERSRHRQGLNRPG